LATEDTRRSVLALLLTSLVVQNMVDDPRFPVVLILFAAYLSLVDLFRSRGSSVAYGTLGRALRGRNGVAAAVVLTALSAVIPDQAVVLRKLLGGAGTVTGLASAALRLGVAEAARDSMARLPVRALAELTLASGACLVAVVPFLVETLRFASRPALAVSAVLMAVGFSLRPLTTP
jgi:hypothetical protein